MSRELTAGKESEDAVTEVEVEEAEVVVEAVAVGSDNLVAEVVRMDDDTAPVVRQVAVVEACHREGSVAIDLGSMTEGVVGSCFGS